MVGENGLAGIGAAGGKGLKNVLLGEVKSSVGSIVHNPADIVKPHLVTCQAAVVAKVGPNDVDVTPYPHADR